MPTTYINAITKKIGASYNGHHYLVDCATRKDLPNIEFHFGETKVVLTLDDYSWTYFVCIVLCASQIFKFLLVIMAHFFII